ncbi:hypothetical protein [Flavobacterium sp.]
MKIFVIIIALTLFLKPVFPVLDYMVNYDYIAKVLCENKAKPELKCNGKCHLMKELAKESENEKPIQNNKKLASSEFEVLFFQDIASLKFTQVFIHDTSINFDNYSNQYFHLNSTSIFHPPIFIS